MKISKLLYWLLVVVLSVAMLISGSIVIRYIVDAVQQKEEYDHLAAMVEQARLEAAVQSTVSPVAPTVSPGPEQPAAPTEPPVPSILPEYAAAYEDNSDLVGWMIIDGTPINYPVMQTPDRVDYYLHRNFQREHNSHGCLYVRESCDVFAPSDNLTIYGHHMKDGSMFKALDKYMDPEFRDKYPTIRFDTLYTHQTYTIFAVFTTTASVGKGFSYHLFEDAADEAEFNEFVSTCKSLAIYDTGITPQFGDKLISLSTCEYSQANGRLVVVAVRD